MNDNIKLYTLPTCGICKIVKKKLMNKQIKYTEYNLKDYMYILNTDHAPVLEVNGIIYNSPTQINAWINAQ